VVVLVARWTFKHNKEIYVVNRKRQQGRLGINVAMPKNRHLTTMNESSAFMICVLSPWAALDSVKDEVQDRFSSGVILTELTGSNSIGRLADSRILQQRTAKNVEETHDEGQM
jgi:hypothetical protein